MSQNPVFAAAVVAAGIVVSGTALAQGGFGPQELAISQVRDDIYMIRSAASGNITITEDGTIEVDGGSAVTVNSNNTVSNDGAITVGDADGASGIDVASGISTTITNSGTIAITEDFVAENADGNAIVDGPIAEATDRAGIRVRGPFTGTIDHSGAINVEGLNSAGIRVDDTLTG